MRVRYISHNIDCLPRRFWILRLVVRADDHREPVYGKRVTTASARIVLRVTDYEYCSRVMLGENTVVSVRVVLKDSSQKLYVSNYHVGRCITSGWHNYIFEVGTMTQYIP